MHPHAPGRGRVAIFNRSHYEDVLVVRVHKLVPKDVWKPRYDFINDWEKLLATENNTTILKFFLYISKEEQLARFKERLDDPARQWKISDSDYAERDLWDEYIDAFEAALSRCSTKYAPWFVIPANHKWFRNLAVSQIVADALDDMKLELPKPTVDLKEIRRLYHQDAAARVGHGEAKNGKNKSGKNKHGKNKAATNRISSAIDKAARGSARSMTDRSQTVSSKTVSSKTSVFGALDDAPMTFAHYRYWLLASGGTLLDGFSVVSLGIALPLLRRDFAIAPAMLGLIGSALVLGAVLGAAVGGVAADRIGRKRAFLVDMAILAAGSALCVIAQDPWLILAGQFVIGVGIGIDFPTSGSYVVRDHAKSPRSRMTVATIAMQSVGMVAQRWSASPSCTPIRL